MSRFFRRGKTRVFFITTIAAPAAPTAAEFLAGTELTSQIAEMAGFSFSNSPIQTPDMASAFTAQIGGEDTAEQSSITFYLDDTTNALRTTLAKGVKGFVAILDNPGTGVITTTKKTDVWPVSCDAAPKEYSTGNDPARWTCQMSITSPPNVDVAVV